MGQRTAIIVQHVNNYKYANHVGEMDTRVFYHGWGIGRILPSHLLSVVNATLSQNTYYSYYSETSIAAKFKPAGTTDLVEEGCYEDADIALFDELNFDNPEDVGRILQQADNNNGGIFVRLTTGADGSIAKIEYAYMLGHEEGGDYKHFCTGNEWMNHFDGYCDKKFKKLYTQTLAYHGAIERANGEEKNDEAAA